MNVWKTLNLYIHTLRYLRVSQLIHRLNRFRKTRIKLTEIPTCELHEETFGSKCNPRESVMLSENKFRFLNSEEEFTDGVSWHLNNKDPLCFIYINADWKGKKTKIPNTVFELFTSTIIRLGLTKLYRVSGHLP